MTACRTPSAISRSIHGRNRFGIARTLWIFFTILLLPAAAAELTAASKISDYRPVFRPFHDEGGVLLAAVRRYRNGSEDLSLVLDPYRFEFRIVASEKILSAEAAGKDAWRDTPFARALSRYTAPPHHFRNSGLRESGRPVKGVFLTADLCPSRKPLDRRFIETTASLPQKAPVPLTLMVTGPWIRRHEADFAWIREQALAGRLSITWGNHSFSHFYDPVVPSARNFLLRPGTDLTKEALSLELLLLDHGVMPSPFFRFPGLLSDMRLIEGLRDLSLLPIGGNAWLAKGEQPTAGSVILVHGNGNEPVGIRRLHAFYREQHDAFLQGETSLLPLREAFLP
jgi:hypothetical protein